ncbi:MAG: ligase-associated DNA damage response DEXH box helicase [Bacteroidia bacterium]
MRSSNISEAEVWFARKNWNSFPFQKDCWNTILKGEQGLLNAPTGSGKTFALFLGFLLRAKNQKKAKKGLKLIWITPLRALSADIAAAMAEAINEIHPTWTVAVRTGDTKPTERAKLKRNPPDVLVTTPESLHLMLASKQSEESFDQLDGIVVDEWHELAAGKRGVQVELALSRIRSFRPELITWGISATIGNLKEAASVLFGSNQAFRIIKADIKKEPLVIPIYPDVIERFPWSGHLGIHLLPQVLQVIHTSNSVLLFTNTRSQAEIWYREILEAAPELAGVIAMHHGSISKDLRFWVENALHEGVLKVVVCTSSLDLGVDFRPVDTIIQVGSPKGVARFLQRAGRSGHRPGEQSKIWFLPTHALELIECAALREAIKNEDIEARKPLRMCFDVLVQYLVTLAVGDGFYPEETYEQVKSTHCYADLSSKEWKWMLDFISTGGDALKAYPEYARVEIDETGKYLVLSRKTAMRHRMHIGTIVSDSLLSVGFRRGGTLGHVEESFVSKLKPGDVFWFSGRPLELIHVRDMKVVVQKAKTQKGIVPQWMGGRMLWSSELSNGVRAKLGEVHRETATDEELLKLKPLFDVQKNRSAIPSEKQFLIEQLKSRDGFHIFFYPFEGRYIHEGLAALLAWRISQLSPISFSLAMNDYGFELLSDKPLPLMEALEEDLFRIDSLRKDIELSVNSTELARRVFREIASISGLVFQGFPGKLIGTKHLQNSSRLMFDVFSQYDQDNLLLKQAFSEVYSNQLEEQRIREALLRIRNQEVILVELDRPSPFSFPILVDRLRGSLSSESLEDRIKKMQVVLEK